MSINYINTLLSCIRLRKLLNKITTKNYNKNIIINAFFEKAFFDTLVNIT